MDKTDRLRDYGLAFLLYEQGLGVCGYELIRELFIFVKLILNSYLDIYLINSQGKTSTSYDYLTLLSAFSCVKKELHASARFSLFSFVSGSFSAISNG